MTTIVGAVGSIVGWGLVGWLAGGAFFITWEANALRKRDDGFPTLTNVIKHYVPKWVMAMALGWLAWHFLAGNEDGR